MCKRVAIVSFLVALVTRFVVGWQSFLSPTVAFNNDSQVYLDLAKEIVHGHFSSIFRTPGYPLFLAMTGSFRGSALFVTLLVQVFLDCMVAVMLASIVWRLMRNTSAALLAGLMWALCPVVVVLTTKVATETLFVFLAVAALYSGICLCSLSGVVVQAACWSAATLTRPSGVLLPFIVCLFLIVVKLKAKSTPWLKQITVLGIYILIVSLWVGFNYLRTGMPVLCSLPDVAVYMYELPAVQMVDRYSWIGYTDLWVRNPREAERIRQVNEDTFRQEVFGDSAAHYKHLWFTAEDPQTVRWLREEARMRLRGRLPTMIGTHLIGALQTLRPMPPWGLGGFAATLLDGIRLLLLPIAIVGLARARQRLLLAFFSVWIAYALLLPGVCGTWRYRSMAEPAITLALAIGLTPLLVHRKLWQRLMNWIEDRATGVILPAG